ncbi:hypothetical protein HK405_012242, partial [Cladochytrium tenue]
TTTSTSTSTSSSATSTVSPVVIIRPYADTVFSYSDTIMIEWSYTTSSTSSIVFYLEDLRNGVSTGQPLSPSLGNASLSATTLTTKALSSLFQSGVITTGTNYAIRGTYNGVDYFSPQFTINVGGSSSTASTTGSSSSSSSTSKSSTGAAGRTVASGGLVAAAVAGAAAALQLAF